MQNLDQQKDSIPSFGLVSHKYEATNQIVKDNVSTRPFTVSADRPVDDIALGCCHTIASAAQKKNKKKKQLKVKNTWKKERLF